MPENESPTLLRRQLGRFLRERRDETGMTMAVAAEAVQLSSAALQRLETGRPQKLRKQDVRALCELYGVDDEETKAAIGLAEQAASNPEVTSIGGLFSNAFNMYVGMERSARTLTTYQEQVPGLLQTADYARATFSAFPGYDSSDDIERRVDIRLNRQVIVTRRVNPLAIEVLLHESALHRSMGGPRVMATQLKHMADMSTEPNITLRVHPYSAGMTWGFLHGPFVILDFGEGSKEPPVVYVEGRLASDLYTEKQDEVRRYYELSEAIRSTALDETSTRDLLRQVARGFEGER
ncbi:helix-turn-helix transcriptional regulator [Nocardia sp. CS682]|uniref:helix-turn-helix domain-containing protein n=1 Tax=Nocardia sp. CS682 TaxID=1047172 RepID=UPI001074F901|nr:helix-turn-helix transcriptional regulator [Nocardia sp. CS682]QBS43846.1 XRE family transcriptional regulator [Nocardia sp. CS682]